MNLIERLEKYREEVAAVFPSVQWYGQKNDLTDIDLPEAVLAYSTDLGKADTHTHFIMVTLTLYVSNPQEVSYDLAKLGYNVVDETAVDDNMNVSAAYQKQVVVL